MNDHINIPDAGDRPIVLYAPAGGELLEYLAYLFLAPCPLVGTGSQAK
jgi:hypothetical protein